MATSLVQAFATLILLSFVKVTSFLCRTRSYTVNNTEKRKRFRTLYWLLPRYLHSIEYPSRMYPYMCFQKSLNQSKISPH